MRNITLFEEFKVKNRPGIKDSWDKGGTQNIMGTYGGNNKVNKSSIKSLDKSMEKIVKYFGISGKVKYMDSGSYGMAFSCGKYIIKLTSEIKEVREAEKMIGRDIPGCVKYYKIKYQPKFEIWAIMMDKVDSLSENQIGIINDIQRFALSETGKVSISKSLEFFSTCPIDKFLKFYKIKRGKNHPNYKILEEVYNDFQILIKKLIKSNICLDDVHSGNIGYKNGELISFDIMSF